MARYQPICPQQGQQQGQPRTPLEINATQPISCATNSTVHAEGVLIIKGLAARLHLTLQGADYYFYLFLLTISPYSCQRAGSSASQPQQFRRWKGRDAIFKPIYLKKLQVLNSSSKQHSYEGHQNKEKGILGIKQLNEFNCTVSQKGLKKEFLLAEDVTAVNSDLTQPDPFNSTYLNL